MAEYRLYDLSGDYLFRRGLSWVAVGLDEEASFFSLTTRLLANERERMRARTSGARASNTVRQGSDLLPKAVHMSIAAACLHLGRPSLFHCFASITQSVASRL